MLAFISPGTYIILTEQMLDCKWGGLDFCVGLPTTKYTLWGCYAPLRFTRG